MYIKVKAEGPEKKFIALSGEVRRVKTFRDIRQLAEAKLGWSTILDVLGRVLQFSVLTRVERETPTES